MNNHARSASITHTMENKNLEILKETWAKPSITLLNVNDETMGFAGLQLDHNNSGSVGS